MYHLPFNTPTNQLYEITNTYSLDEIYRIETLKISYNIINKKMKSNIILIRNSEIHNHETRQYNLFHLDAASSLIGQKRFTHSALTEFNKLPDNIKNCRNIGIFKNEVKKLIISERTG